MRLSGNAVIGFGLLALISAGVAHAKPVCETSGVPKMPSGFDIAYSDGGSGKFDPKAAVNNINDYVKIPSYTSGAEPLSTYKIVLRAKNNRKVQGGTLKAGETVTGFSRAKSVCDGWLVPPDFAEVVPVHTGLFYVRVPGSTTMSIFRPGAKAAEPTPFTEIRFASSRVNGAPDSRNEKGLGYYGIQPTGDGRTQTVSFLGADGNVMGTAENVVTWEKDDDMPWQRRPVEAFEQGGFVVHRLGADGQIMDQIFTETGIEASPPLPAIPLFRAEVSDYVSATIFAMETDRDRDLLWPILSPDMLSAKPANLLGMRPIDGYYAHDQTWISHDIYYPASKLPVPYAAEMWCLDCAAHQPARKVHGWAVLWQTERGERWAIIPDRLPSLEMILDSYSTADVTSWTYRKIFLREGTSRRQAPALVAGMDDGTSAVGLAGQADWREKPLFAGSTYGQALSWADASSDRVWQQIDAEYARMAAEAAERARIAAEIVAANYRKAEAEMQGLISQQQWDAAQNIAIAHDGPMMARLIDAYLSASPDHELTTWMWIEALMAARPYSSHVAEIDAAVSHQTELRRQRDAELAAEAARQAAYQRQWEQQIADYAARQAAEKAAWAAAWNSLPAWNPAIAASSGPNRTNEIMDEMRWKSQQNYLNGNTSYQVCQSVGGCSR